MQTSSLVHAEPRRAPSGIGGHVAPGFEEVRAEFQRNFAERGEIGAAVAAYVRGKKVVDLDINASTSGASEGRLGDFLAEA